MVNAAHSFYNGTTTLPISDEDRTPRKRISKTLNMTTSPEEKRKIIGDTFVKVMCIIIIIYFLMISRYVFLPQTISFQSSVHSVASMVVQVVGDLKRC